MQAGDRPPGPPQDLVAPPVPPLDPVAPPGPPSDPDPPGPQDPPDPPEPLSQLWGLDPLFSAFVRLFVSDILDMTESTQVPGIFFYNSRPVYKVDVLGTVVFRRERDDFFCYGVDDGTGVINCLCWKTELMREDGSGSGSGTGAGTGTSTSTGTTQGGFNAGAELTRLRRAQQNRSRLEIGELIRVRGAVKTNRNQNRNQNREITASCFYKVDDPVLAVQTSWMLEVPELYRTCYDRRYQLGPGTETPVSTATALLKDFLQQRSVTRFRPYDVQDLLQPLVPVLVPAQTDPVQPPAAEPEPGSGPGSGPAGRVQEPSSGSGSGPGPGSGPARAQQLRQLLQEVLQVLLDQGVVYRRVKSQDEVYHVTVQDTDLLMAVQDVIREDSRREKYQDTGVHVLQVLSSVRQRYSLNVTRPALDLVLQNLEARSDIISTRDQYYTAL